jgi:hypothetical protein
MYGINNSPRQSVEDLRVNVCEFCMHKFCSDCESLNNAICNEIHCSECHSQDCSDCYDYEQALEFIDPEQAQRLDLVITR